MVLLSGAEILRVLAIIAVGLLAGFFALTAHSYWVESRLVD
jgi:hypothetical protein